MPPTHRNHAPVSFAQRSPVSPATPTGATKDEIGHGIAKQMRAAIHDDPNSHSSPKVIGWCEQLVEHFPKIADEYDATYPLWQRHYNSLRAAEAALISAPDDPQTRLQFDAAVQGALAHLQRLQAMSARYGNTSFGLRIIFKLLIYTGDVERYRDRNAPRRVYASGLHCDADNEMPNSDFVASIQSYTAAWHLVPTNGQACNQLAIVYQSKRRVLEASYFYLRAAFAKKPFKRAFENFVALAVSSASASSFAGSPPSTDDILSVPSELERTFLFLLESALRGPSGPPDPHEAGVVEALSRFRDALQRYTSPSAANSIFKAADRLPLRMLLTAIAISSVTRQPGPSSTNEPMPNLWLLERVLAVVADAACEAIKLAVATEMHRTANGLKLSSSTATQQNASVISELVGAFVCAARWLCAVTRHEEQSMSRRALFASAANAAVCAARDVETELSSAAAVAAITGLRVPAADEAAVAAYMLPEDREITGFSAYIRGFPPVSRCIAPATPPSVSSPLAVEPPQLVASPTTPLPATETQKVAESMAMRIAAELLPADLINADLGPEALLNQRVERLRMLCRVERDPRFQFVNWRCVFEAPSATPAVADGDLGDDVVCSWTNNGPIIEDDE